MRCSVTVPPPGSPHPEQAGPDAGLGGSQRNPFVVGDLLGGVAAHHSEHDGACLLGWQFPEMLDGLRGVELLVDIARRVAQGGGDQVVEHRVVGRGGSPGADGVDRQVTGDRQQPGEHRSAPDVVGAGRLPGPQEGLLTDILGEPAIAGDRDRQAEDPALEAADEGHRGRPSPSARAATRAASEARSVSENRVTSVGTDEESPRIASGRNPFWPPSRITGIPAPGIVAAPCGVRNHQEEPCPPPQLCASHSPSEP